MLIEDTLKCIQCSHVYQYHMKFSPSQDPVVTNTEATLPEKPPPARKPTVAPAPKTQQQDAPMLSTRTTPSKEAETTLHGESSTEQTQEPASETQPPSRHPQEEAEPIQQQDETQAPEPDRESLPYGLTPEEAEEAFSTHHKALYWLLEKRWPEGPKCIKCNSENLLHQPNRQPPKFRCNECGTEFSMLHGTQMGGTRTELNRWMGVHYDILHNPSEPENAIALRHKVAWITENKIRHATTESKDLGLNVFDDHTPHQRTKPDSPIQTAAQPPGAPTAQTAEEDGDLPFQPEAPAQPAGPATEEPAQEDSQPPDQPEASGSTLRTGPEDPAPEAAQTTDNAKDQQLPPEPQSASPKTLAELQEMVTAYSRQLAHEESALLNRLEINREAQAKTKEEMETLDRAIQIQNNWLNPPITSAQPEQNAQ